MAKYDEYDSALKQKIANGCDTLNALTGNTELKKLAEPHRTPGRWGIGTPYFRIVDRRLQALRKKGELIYQDKRWSVAI